MAIFFDQLNRRIEISTHPKRIVSLVPSQTELLVDLGLKDRIVGVTKFCVHPKNLRKEKKIAGGTKTVHYDRIKNLEPDIILCNKEENTKDMVMELEKIAPVHVSEVKTIEDSMALIGQYGKIFGVGPQASEIIEKITILKGNFEEYVSGFPVRKVAYFIWKDPWMVAGKDNFIDHLLQVNRFKNAFSEENSRYPEITLDQLDKEGVEFVFLSTEPFPFKEEDKNLFGNRGLKACALVVDGEYFSWYGSRLLAAFRYFQKLQEDLRFS